MKKLYTLLSALLFAVSSWAGTLYVTGGATGLNYWSPDNPTVITSETNQYEFTYKDFVSFKMSTAKGDWDTFNGSALGTGSELEANKTIKLEPWGEDLQLPWVGEWTVKVDLDAMTMVLTTTTPKPVGYKKLYLRGDMNNWGTTTELATADGVVYTLDNVDIAKGQGFKIADANWGSDNYGSQANMEVNKDYKLQKGGGTSNCTMKEAVKGGKLSFNITTQNFRIDAAGDAETDCQIYWDNKLTNWTEVYCLLTDADGEEFDPYPGNPMDATSVEGIYTFTAPAGYVKVKFNNGEGAESPVYTVKNNYIYSISIAGIPYEAPKDFSNYYVNVPGEFNNWGDNGVQPDADGIATLTLTDVVGNFKVKVYDGSNDVWYSNGATLIANSWMTLDGMNVDPGMRLPVALQSGAVKIEFDCNKNAIRVSQTKLDLSTYYVNIVGPFNNWEANGVQPDVETGIADVTVSGMTAEGFKIKVWTGSTDVWYCNGSEIAPSESWVKIVGNSDTTMTVPSTAIGKDMLLQFNVLNGEMRYSLLDAIENISTENNAAPVYYNLQGIRVDNPANGLFIEVRGNKTTKVLK